MKRGTKLTLPIVIAKDLCGAPARHGAPCGLDKQHAKRGERHSNGRFTWALRGKQDPTFKTRGKTMTEEDKRDLIRVGDHGTWCVVVRRGRDPKGKIKDNFAETACGDRVFMTLSDLDFIHGAHLSPDPRAGSALRNVRCPVTTTRKVKLDEASLCTACAFAINPYVEDAESKARRKIAERDATMFSPEALRQAEVDQSSEPRVEYDEPEGNGIDPAFVDDGMRCGVRMSKHGAACILDQEHEGDHSTGYRTFANVPRAKPSKAKPLEPQPGSFAAPAAMRCPQRREFDAEGKRISKIVQEVCAKSAGHEGEHVGYRPGGNHETRWEGDGSKGATHTPTNTTTNEEATMTKPKGTLQKLRASTKKIAAEAVEEAKPVPLKHPPGRLFGYRRHAAGAIWPIIEGEEFDELVRSIKERGQDDDIVLVKVDDETFVLDGWNRARACDKLKVKPKFTKYIGKVDIDSLLDYVDMKNDRRRHVSKSIRAMIAARAASLRRGKAGPASRGSTSATPTQKAAAAAKGVSDKYVRKAANVQEIGTPKLNDAVMAGRISVEAAGMALKLPAAKQDELADKAMEQGGEFKAGKVRAMVNQEAKRAIVAKVNKEQVHPMPIGPFRVIRIDPPWPYDNSDQHEGSRGHMPYPPMSIAAICQMRGDIDKLVHEDGCILALDVPNAFIHEVGRVLEAWGFTHRTMRTWDKGRIGMGTWCRGQTEHLVIASRGMPVHTLNEVSTYVGAKAREHSRKPDQFADDLLKHCPGPHVELFAREAREGWATWGAETSKFDASKEVA